MEKLQQLVCRLILGVNYLYIILHKKYPTWNCVKRRRIERKTSEVFLFWFFNYDIFLFLRKDSWNKEDQD